MYGGKKVLLYAYSIWSLVNAFTPLALALGGTPALLTAKFIIGMTEGVVYPSIFRLFTTWFPRGERTRAVALTLSSVEVGTLVTVALTVDNVSG